MRDSKVFYIDNFVQVLVNSAGKASFSSLHDDQGYIFVGKTPLHKIEVDAVEDITPGSFTILDKYGKKHLFKKIPRKSRKIIETAAPLSVEELAMHRLREEFLLYSLMNQIMLTNDPQKIYFAYNILTVGLSNINHQLMNCL